MFFNSKRARVQGPAQAKCIEHFSWHHSSPETPNRIDKQLYNNGWERYSRTPGRLLVAIIREKTIEKGEISGPHAQKHV